QRDLLCVVLALMHSGALDIGTVFKQPVRPLGAGRVELRVTRPPGLTLVRDPVGREPVVDRLLQQRPASVTVGGVTPRAPRWPPGLSDQAGRPQGGKPVGLAENLLDGLDRWHGHQGTYPAVAFFRRAIMWHPACREALGRDGAKGVAKLV